jgi:Transcription factor WhiB
MGVVELPKPNTASREVWIRSGECRGMDVALFYPKPSTLLAEGRGRPPRGEGISREAVDACEKCVVKSQCAEWAISHEGHGYWGGMTERERARIRSNEGIILWEPQSTITYIGNVSPFGDARLQTLSKIPHGTPSGYKMERRRGMEPCDACRAAHSAQTYTSRHRAQISA